MAFFDDNKRIGVGLCALGAILGFLGLVLLFDRVLLSLANFAFILGIGFIIGPYGAARFFLKKEKLRGSFCYFSGLGVILYGWAMIGIFVQLYGVWLLFSALLPNILASIKLTPVGFIFNFPGLKQLSNWIYDQRRLPL